jgi:hypothetical protein
VTLPAIFVVLYVCHQVGDYLVQTDWQARNKAGGLGADPVARRALFAHVTTYTLAFAPALAWIGVERTAAIAFAAPCWCSFLTCSWTTGGSCAPTCGA